MISYKLLVGISADLQLKCSWKCRWSDEILRPEGQR